MSRGFRSNDGPAVNPTFVGYEFGSNQLFGHSSRDRQSQRLTIHETIEQDLLAVSPSYIDFGWDNPGIDLHFPDNTTHISLAVAEPGNHSTEDAELLARQCQETNAYHRLFGWEEPIATPGMQEIAHRQLALARAFLSWERGAGRPLLISMEAIRTTLPILDSDRYAYDETMHTDATNPVWPVAQGFWANTRHTLVSTNKAYIGEGSEALRQTHGPDDEPSNVVFCQPSFTEKQLPSGHLIMADSKRLPHGRPNLATPLEEGDIAVRYFLRTYIQPLMRPSDKLKTHSRQLGQIAAYYGLTGLQWNMQ